MNFFEEATLRLKQQLHLTQDKEVAALLGLSPRAWAGRKKNASFPLTELYALIAQRPDLGVDPVYVLKGHSAHTEAELVKLRAATGAAANMGLTGSQAVRAQEAIYQALSADQLAPDERVLIASYRACNDQARQNLIQTAALFAAGGVPAVATSKVKNSVQVGGGVGAGAVLVGSTKGAVDVGQSRRRK